MTPKIEYIWVYGGLQNFFLIRNKIKIKKNKKVKFKTHSVSPYHSLMKGIGLSMVQD